MYAARAGNLELAQALLKGLNHAVREKLFAYQNAAGETALILACKNGHDQLVRLFLDNGATDTIFDAANLSGFMHAAQAGHNNVIEAMLAHPYFGQTLRRNIWQKNDKDQTGLALAAQNGVLAAVIQFVDAGASIFARDRDGFTPFMRAVQNGHLQVARYIYEKADITPYALIETAQYVRSASYVSPRADLLTQTNLKGETALILAAQKGFAPLVKFLIECKARVTTADANNWTALMYAAQGKHEEIMRDLLAVLQQPHTAVVLRYGIVHIENVKDFVNHTSNEGDTALTLACTSCAAQNIKCVTMLLDADAEPEVFDSAGFSPIMRVSFEGNEKLLTVLLTHRKIKPRFEHFINLKNDPMNRYYRNYPRQKDEHRSTTALILASAEGHLPVVKLLISLGAHKHIRNALDHTAYDEAYLAGKDAVAQFLKVPAKSSFFTYFLGK